MTNEVKKYDWSYNDNKYTLLEYLTKVEELISSPVTQMQECDGDLFITEYHKLISGSYKLTNLVEKLKKEQEE